MFSVWKKCGIGVIMVDKKPVTLLQKQGRKTVETAVKSDYVNYYCLSLIISLLFSDKNYSVICIEFVEL